MYRFLALVFEAITQDLIVLYSYPSCYILDCYLYKLVDGTVQCLLNLNFGMLKLYSIIQ